MAYLEHPAVVKVAYIHEHWNQDVVNTLHWFSGLPLTQARINEFIGGQQDYYVDIMPSQWTHQMAYQRMTVRQMIRNGPLGADRQLLGGQAGAITVNGNRPAEACSIKLSTASFGKSGSGTWFGGGLPDNVVIGGELDDNYRTNYATALSNFVAAFKADFANWTPVIYSQYTNKAQRGAVVLYPITAMVSVTRYPAHMSSRNPGSGQ